MAVPKRKVSRSKVRSRKAGSSNKPAQVSSCPECGAARQSHRVCPECGFYRGRQVKTVEAD
jgi:large subunit ribosomal protein L32